MQNITFKLFSETPLLAVFIVFWAGAISTLSSCVLVELPVIFGYVSSAADSRKKGYFLSLCFALGITLGYTILGILVTLILNLFWHLVGISQYVYLVLGSFLFLSGLTLTGLINFKIPFGTHLVKNWFKPLGFLGAFLFGTFFAFIEMPACPLCGPLLFIIAGLVAPKGLTWYSLIIFLSFALGQSFPAFIIGSSTNFLKYLPAKVAESESDFRLIGGNILMVAGLYFLLIS